MPRFFANAVFFGARFFLDGVLLDELGTSDFRGYSSSGASG